MKQHFLSLTDNEYLYQRAVLDCFGGKWSRNDVLSFIEKYAGIPRHEILINELEIYEDKGRKREHNAARIEAVDSCALTLEETVTKILDGDNNVEEIELPRIRSRPDGMTGKVRDIALLCIMHQLVEHTAFILLEPLFKKRLYPTQHASIPKRGQTRLKDQLHKFLRSGKLRIRYYAKTDMRHAYASVQYSTVISLLKEDIPDANHIFKLLEYLGSIAPGGHLIIGGYLDAWLFNYVMSKVMASAYSAGQTRRGKFTRYAVRLITFMDDMWIGAASEKAIKRIIKTFSDFSGKIGMEVKTVTDICKVLPVEAENQRKKLHGARRGCPMVDMAGYRVGLTHITIRKRVFLRIRRQLLRALGSVKSSGTIGIQRARKLISYNGYIKQTNSEKLKEKYQIPLLMRMAKKIVSFHSKLAHRKRMEKLNDLRKRTEQYAAGLSRGGKSAGWPAENYHFAKHLGGTARRRNTVPV